MQSHNWVIDFHFRHESRASMYRVQNTVVNTLSDYQQVLIVDLADFGRALILDGSLQSSALDEHIYHQALVHPAMIASPAPKKVFVAGGGEGATLREILRHNTVEQVTMVDIDPVLVELARQYLGEWHQGAFDDPRVKLLHQDARAYLENCPDKFDCIISDVVEPTGESPAALLFTQEFFQIVQSRLNPGGTLALQAEAADVSDYEAHVSIVKTLQTCFNSVRSYQVGVACFSATWGFAVASDSPLDQRLNPQTIPQVLSERNCANLRFYDAESHLHMFSLPKYLRNALQDPDVGMIIRDEHLLVVD
jgi:spermidine synthase